MERDNTAGAGGDWPVIDEKSDPAVVHQILDASCVSACGEMLMRDRGVGSLSQDTLLDQLGSPAIMVHLADVLNRMSGAVQWRSTGIDVPTMGERRAVDLLNATGSWAAGLFSFGARLMHAVVVDGANDDDTLNIRDPFDGTSYRMEVDVFLDYWSWIAVWQVGGSDEG